MEHNPNTYRILFDKCQEKMRELTIPLFDFENNPHIQDAPDMNALFKNFVYHSQNRAQGYAINFFKCESEAATAEERQRAAEVWNAIEQYQFDLDDKFSYICLFYEFKALPSLNDIFSLTKGNDILYLGLAKTCQCIKKYLSRYENLEAFKQAHTFTGNAKENWRILDRVSRNIHNMGTELVPDFFKEQNCVEGRDFLMKADLHVKRFFTAFSDSKRNLSDKKVYELVLSIYSESDWEDKENHKPYQIDKYIYLIGAKLNNPELMKEFAVKVKNSILCSESP